MALLIALSRRVRTLRWMAALAVVLLLAAAAAFATAPMMVEAWSTLPAADSVPGAPKQAVVPPDDPAVQAPPPGCAVWTDRCVTCSHKAGQVSCSNIGIACQPRAVECVRSEQADEKEKKGDEDKGAKQESGKQEN
jgi:hypothetical protein